MPVNRREWDHDPVHDDVDANSIEKSGDHGMAREECQLAARQEENCGGAEGDDKMKEETERGRRRTAVK